MLRLARAILARECLGWSAIAVWASRHPDAHWVEVSTHRRARHPLEVSTHRRARNPLEVTVVCLAQDGTRLANRRWYTHKLSADLAERLGAETRLPINRSGDGID
jgi:hypothetical protein